MALYERSNLFQATNCKGQRNSSEAKLPDTVKKYPTEAFLRACRIFYPEVVVDIA
jgi:hypothetical protein